MAVYRGLAFPFKKGATGIPEMDEDESLVWDDVRSLFYTKKRSRVMKPTFGVNLEKLVFENTGALLNAKIYREIATALVQFENRATLYDISIEETETKVTIDTQITVNGITETVSVTIDR